MSGLDSQGLLLKLPLPRGEQGTSVPKREGMGAVGRRWEDTSEEGVKEGKEASPQESFPPSCW